MEYNDIDKSVNRIRKMVMKWPEANDKKLFKQVNEIINSNVYELFVQKIYPSIKDINVKQKIKEILLKFIKDTNSDINMRIRAVYLSAMLNLPDIEKSIINIISNIDDNQIRMMKNDETLLNLNGAIKIIKLKSASDFLCRQLDIHLNNPEPVDSSHLGSTIWILEEVDSDKAAPYWNKMGISESLYKHVSEWNNLSDKELKEEVEKVISGHGMGGMASPYMYLDFIPKIYPKIKGKELKEKINTFLMESIDELNGNAARAIYICTHLQLLGIKEKLLDIVNHNSENIFKIIEQATGIADSDFNLSIMYISELNRAVGYLNIHEAQIFLIKQLAPLKKSPPPPLTKEHVFYYVCARSALDVLRVLNPDVVKDYDDLEI